MFKNSCIRYRMWALIFSLLFIVFTYFVNIYYNYYETLFQNPSLDASIVWPFGVFRLTGTSGIISYSVVFIFYLCFIVVVSTGKNNPRNIAIMLGLMAVNSLYSLLYYINMDNSVYSFAIYSIKNSLWKLASFLILAVLFLLKNKKTLKKENAVQIIIIGMIVITLFLDGIRIGPFYSTMTCFDVSALLRYLSLLLCLSLTDKAQNACEHGLF